MRYLLALLAALLGCSPEATPPMRSYATSQPTAAQQATIVRGQLEQLVKRADRVPPGFEDRGWSDLRLSWSRLQNLGLVGHEGLRDSVLAALRDHYRPVLERALAALPPDLSRFAEALKRANRDADKVRFTGKPLSPEIEDALSAFRTATYEVSAWATGEEALRWRELDNAIDAYQTYQWTKGNVTAARRRMAEDAAAAADLRRIEEENAAGARARERRLARMSPEERAAW